MANFCYTATIELRDRCDELKGQVTARGEEYQSLDRIRGAASSMSEDAYRYQGQERFDDDYCPGPLSLMKYERCQLQEMGAIFEEPATPQ